MDTDDEARADAGPSKKFVNLIRRSVSATLVVRPRRPWDCCCSRM